MNPPDFRPTLDRLRRELLVKRSAAGHWRGRLSDSALATATACSALGRSLDDLTGEHRDHAQRCVAAGMRALAASQNEDGGFGDTDRSLSNIATSTLVLAADAICQDATGGGIGDAPRNRLLAAIEAMGGRDGLKRRYGRDKTFVVPILTNLAIAGLVPWRDVPPLPFEAAWLPQRHYRRVGLPVVSYAVPALVAIGQAKHLLDRSAWPIAWLRDAAISPTLRVLRSMQPASGGFLEATPLTAFVCMSLAATDRCDHPVAIAGRQFLVDSMRANGQWPIDTDLATWVTSLATVALASDPRDDRRWQTDELVDWQLACQHRRPHPLSGARPGGWGWTDLSGAVPDADDTPAAIISLSGPNDAAPNDTGPNDTGPNDTGPNDTAPNDTAPNDTAPNDTAPNDTAPNDTAPNDTAANDTGGRRTGAAPPRRKVEAIRRGGGWLLGLQNRDGGFPTFCRGWGKLPFDRSSCDLTAHVLRAFAASKSHRRGPNYSYLRQSVDGASRRATGFLRKQQQPDGSWLPLWFGNQDRPGEDNPVYGTARVLLGVQPARGSRRDFGTGIGHRVDPPRGRLPDRFPKSRRRMGRWAVGGQTLWLARRSNQHRGGDRPGRRGARRVVGVRTALRSDLRSAAAPQPRADAAPRRAPRRYNQRVRLAHRRGGRRSAPHRVANRLLLCQAVVLRRALPVDIRRRGTRPGRSGRRHPR